MDQRRIDLVTGAAALAVLAALLLVKRHRKAPLTGRAAVVAAAAGEVGKTDPVPYETDALGILSREITSLTTTITGAPAGMSEDQLSEFLDLQGVGSGRGVERTAADFLISGAGLDVYARFFNAALRDVPEQFDPTQPRAGQLTWETSRRFKNDGTPEAVFGIGVTAPTS